jgi:hypothetical protein
MRAETAQITRTAEIAETAETGDLGKFTTLPIFTQQEAPEAGRARFGWMRRFLVDEASPLHRPIVEVQRRASWICIAIIAQALNEVDYHWYLSYVPFLLPWAAFIPFFLFLSSFVAMIMAIRPSRPRQQTGESVQKRPRRWQRIVLVLTLLTAIGGAAELGRAVVMGFSMAPQFTNDGTSLDTNAAYLLLQGRNPYTDSSILSLVRRFPIEPYWTTPLRAGQLADTLAYPSTWELRGILDTDLKSGSAPEFESKVSYPALSFLTLIPFVLLNIYNVLPFYLLCYLVLVAVGWKIARPEVRPLVLLISLANVGMWSSVVGGNLDMLYILFVVLAWLVLDQRWWSAIFLGLAAASKQPAWLLIPFYAMLVYRRYGAQETVHRLGIVGIIFMAFNLPFLLWSPQAWLAGMLAPIADPMFPMGVGLVDLSTTPLFSYLPGSVYTMLEAVAMLLCLGWYWRICKSHPEAAMLLAFLPLFFAWRSLASYFYSSALPLFILQVAHMLPRRGKPLRSMARPAPDMHAGDESYRERALPAGVSTRAALRLLPF